MTDLEETPIAPDPAPPTPTADNTVGYTPPPTVAVPHGHVQRMVELLKEAEKVGTHWALTELSALIHEIHSWL